MNTPHHLRHSRRTHHRALSVAGIASAVLLLITACSPPTAATSTAGAKDSGTLRIGAPGSTTDSLDPFSNQGAVTDHIRIHMLYDNLTEYDSKGQVRWALATGMTSNAAATEWTITLRRGVKFQDKSTFGAKDVVASIKSILDPATKANGKSLIDFIDPAKLTVVDGHTVKVGLTRPYGAFKDVWASDYLPMAKAGLNPTTPNGTGQFRYQSFTAGQSSTFVRFDDAWRGRAHLAKVQVIDFADNTAAVNALRGNQVDVVNSIPATSAKILAATQGIKVLDNKTSLYLPIVMRSDIAPFNDARVRQAMMLIANRQQLIDSALNGYGQVANDTVGRYSSCAAPPLPQRTQNIAEAKRLLAAAGQSNLTVTIATTNGTAGMVESAQVFAQEAKAAGVTIKVDNMDASAYLAKYTEWPMAVDFYSGPYLQLVQTTLTKGGFGWATRWSDPEFVSLAKEALATSDDAARCTIQQKMKTIENERGANIVWGWVDSLQAYRSTVHGLKPDNLGYTLYHLDSVSVSR